MALPPWPYLFGGSDGDRSRGCILPLGAIVFTGTPERCPRGRSGRETYQHPRPGKLSAEQREAARTAVSAGRTLLDVAVDFGVSHETIRPSYDRSVLRQDERYKAVRDPF